MSFLVYFFVLLVAASSVLFGLDWMQAPLQAPTARERTIQTIAAAAPATAKTTAQAQQAAAAAAAPVTASAQQAAEGTGAPPVAAQPPEEIKAEAIEPKPAPLCDVDACERAYRSFTAADCTYQPSFGERRVCTKGRRPTAQMASGEARAQASCNVTACASAYSSFDAATCTYQSYYGGRRLCTK
jgi:hypothetical protein